MNTDYKSNRNSQEATAIASTNPVMLALSTFKHADRAIDTALRKASQSKRLVIVYGRNINLGLHFMESSVGLYPDLKEQCVKEILADYEQQWKETVKAIADRAKMQGIQVVTYIHAGRFTSLCLEIIEKKTFSDHYGTVPQARLAQGAFRLCSGSSGFSNKLPRN